MRLRLGINTCFAVKRWPLPDEWAQIVADELALGLVQHSLDLIELDAPLDKQADEILAACDRNGIAVHSLFTGLEAYSASLMLGPSAASRARGEARWARMIALAAALGAEAAGGHVGSLSRADADNPARRAERWRELEARLEWLRDVACAAGVGTLLVENMACDREPSRLAQLRDLVREPQNKLAAVRVCLDVGHQCVPGTSGAERDPYHWLRELGTVAAVVHLQQSTADADCHWPFTTERNRLGRIEAPRVLEALAASGASDATLILEVIPPFESEDARVLAELRESAAHWQAALAQYSSGAPSA